MKRQGTQTHTGGWGLSAGNLGISCWCEKCGQRWVGKGGQWYRAASSAGVVSGVRVGVQGWSAVQDWSVVQG